MSTAYYIMYIVIPSFYTLVGSFRTPLNLHIQVYIFYFVDQVSEKDRMYCEKLKFCSAWSPNLDIILISLLILIYLLDSL